jgi:glutamate-ammonia-ligase adenylyltransferase
MATLTTKDLLLAPQLDFQEVAALLGPYRLQDIKKADANLQRMADDPRARALLSEIIDELLTGVGESPLPDQALNNFERFTQATFSKTGFLSYLQQSPRTLWLLGKVFGSSPFLSDILIRNPEYLYWVFDPEVMKTQKKKRELHRDLAGSLRLLKGKEDRLDLLRIFKRKEILRIGIRDLLRAATVEETLIALSDLADVLIQNAYALCEKEMRRKYGIPLYRDRSGKKIRSGFAILAMGKLGGGELNFSSDVDLMYVYASGAGETSGGRGKERLPNPEYFERLSQEISSALHAVKEGGIVYRVDLRLRPEGEMGLIAIPLHGYRRYYAARGETWERLSLLKVRPVGGDRRLGGRFVGMVRSFIYGRPFGAPGRGEVRQLKEKIDEKISAQDQAGFHVKLGFGGIREIEFIVQALQVDFGGKDKEIREPNTMKAMKKLLRRGWLSSEDYRLLTQAYLFLRDVENKLQMVNDYQTHLLPADPNEVGACAMRLGYENKKEEDVADQLLNDYREHTRKVRQLFQKIFNS